MRHLLSLALLLSLAAAAPDGKEGKTDPRRMKPGHAPTPFTAEEIRKACPEGRTDVHRVEVKGQPPVLRTSRFVKCDEAGADMEAAHASEDGKDLGTKKGYAKWEQLQAHASFPESEVKITEESIETPAGTFDCWLYTVTRAEGGKSSVMRMHFAKKMPGPPVKFVQELDGEVVYAMTLVEHKAGGAEDKPAAGPEKEPGSE